MPNIKSDYLKRNVCDAAAAAVVAAIVYMGRTHRNDKSMILPR